MNKKYSKHPSQHKQQYICITCPNAFHGQSLHCTNQGKTNLQIRAHKYQDRSTTNALWIKLILTNTFCNTRIKLILFFDVFRSFWCFSF
jgi:hypothetical protein